MTADQHLPRHGREHDDAFRMLVVCTGNICRSPLAAELLRARVPAAFPGRDTTSIEIMSAGTVAAEGSEMEPAAIAQAERLGVADARAHRAQRLMPEQIERADLVIAMAREHADAVVGAVPRARRRTFTLVELTRTLEAVTSGAAPVRLDPVGSGTIAEFLRNVVEVAGICRVEPQGRGHGFDIEDPFRRRAAVYKRSADAVAQNVDRLLAALSSLAESEPVAAVAGEASTPAA